MPSRISAYQLKLQFDDPAPIAPGLGNLQQIADAIAAAHAPAIRLKPLKVSGHMRRTLGSFYPTLSEIRLNARLLHLGSDDEIRLVLLHEVAHAIAHHRSPKAPAHGLLFKDVCREIGAEPSKYVDVAQRKWGERTRYAARCRGCDREVMRRRRFASARCDCGVVIEPRRWQVVALKEGGERAVIGTSAPPVRRRSRWRWPGR